MESMVPQAGAVTPVAQVMVQVTVVLRISSDERGKLEVVFVITLAIMGDTVTVTVEELLPQPSAPSASVAPSTSPTHPFLPFFMAPTSRPFDSFCLFAPLCPLALIRTSGSP